MYNDGVNFDSKNNKYYVIKYKKLEDICEIKMCKRILKNETLEFGDIPFYKIGTFGKKADSYITRKLFEEYKSKYSYPRKNEILISCSGTIGKMVIFDGTDSYFQDSNIVWISNNEKEILNKYLYYYLSNIKWKSTEGGTISRLYTSDIYNIKIMIPSIEIQQKIVSKLDKLETIINSINYGLPKEIELRTKQYEYYREQLLTFDK